MKTLRYLPLALAASVLLSACAPLIIGGAAGTVMVASDRRTAGTQLEDETIELRAAASIREQLGTRVRASVTAYNRVALITGEVGNAADKQAVERVVASVQNVRLAVNELVVQATPSLLDRSNDALITGKVKAAFIDAKVPVLAVKVTTERAVVYLLGRVTTEEANRATEAARTVSGVTRVVRLLEIISQQEAERLQIAPKS
ncbi:MAG: BON domain-containing protein [Betaproteobacteria bacterium]